MALIKCPECNKEISDKVKSCPHCGYPIDKSALGKNSLIDLKEKIIRYKKTLIILLLSVVVIAIALTSVISTNNAKQAEIQATLEKEKANINILFKDSIDKITLAGNNSADTCSTILEVWSNAGSRNFNNVFKYMFSGDVQNHEYSGLGMDKYGFSGFSWGEIAEDMNTFKKRLDNLILEKEEVDTKLKEIKAIKRDGYEKEIDMIVNYYNSYLNLYNAATSPSGNQLNYSANLVEMKSKFNSNKVQIDMLVK